ncbi:Ig-like domain-containing protein, partial [Pediococcus acidilactici]|uniref:Ig-like domain-containing protein n=2 Tax=Pediococcus acidilactici TaxID=1254 RepID=UPI0020CC459D
IGNSPQQQEHQNVSDQLTNVTSDFKQSQQSGSYTPVENGNAIYPEASGGLQGNYSFDVPDTVKSGDYFNITISNNLNIYGTRNPSDVRQLPDIKDKNGEIIAKYDLSNDVTGHSFRYNFTDYVDNHNDVLAKISIPLFIDPKVVPNDSEKENITTGIGNKETTNTIKVQYKKFKDVVNYNWPDPTAAANGEAFITAIDHNNKEMTSVIYANPTGNIMQSPWVKVENVNNSNVNYNNRDTRVTVYQLKSGYNPTQSFYIDPDSVIDITGQVPIDFEDNKMYIQFPTDYGPNLNKYIIKYTTTYDDSSTDKIYTRTTNYAGDNPNNYVYWDNFDVTYDPSLSGGGTPQPTTPQPTTPQPTTPQPTTPQPTTPQPTTPQPIGNSPQQQEHQNVSDQLTNVTSDFKQSQQSGS